MLVAGISEGLTDAGSQMDSAARHPAFRCRQLRLRVDSRPPRRLHSVFNMRL
jgi:hypothetical protein